jgi:hypothetical protein
MIYRVLFEGKEAPENVEATFPALAARSAAERLQIERDVACAVVGEDGDVTHWRVSKLESWYARPLDSAAPR